MSDTPLKGSSSTCVDDREEFRTVLRHGSDHYVVEHNEG